MPNATLVSSPTDFRGRGSVVAWAPSKQIQKEIPITKKTQERQREDWRKRYTLVLFRKCFYPAFPKETGDLLGVIWRSRHGQLYRKFGIGGYASEQLKNTGSKDSKIFLQ